mmetsp:Transcript_25364/g.53097  ORF Transcript_25364/g.53097 Transcript_25364/m.53097 type:complete len:109 (+) Transcript_25364:438-764(+)
MGDVAEGRTNEELLDDMAVILLFPEIRSLLRYSMIGWCDVVVIGDSVGCVSRFSAVCDLIKFYDRFFIFDIKVLQLRPSEGEQAQRPLTAFSDVFQDFLHTQSKKNTP